MTIPLFEPEIMANLERAEESVRAAKLLYEAGHCDFAAVHKFLVKTGRLDKDHGKNLNWLFELRGIGDYGDTRHVPREEAAKAIDAAQSFVEAVKALLPPDG